MEKVKKYLNVILLGCSSLFSVLTFATMAGAAVKYGDNARGSYYETMEHVGGLSVAMIFGILALVVAVCLCVCDFLKVTAINKYGKFIAIAGAVFALVSVILYFSTKGIVNNYLNSNSNGWLGALGANYDGLGAGSVLSAIFQMISMVGLCGFAVKDYIIK